MAWLMVQSISARIVSFLAQIVLARLLVPSDFASVALAGTVTAIVGALVSFGVDDVLLQRQRTMRYWLLPAFAISMSLALVSMVITLIAAPFAAALYRAPILLPLLAIMAATTPLWTLSTIPATLLRGQLRFRFMAGYAVFDLIGTQLLTILFAALHFGAFAFALPAPIMATIKAIVWWRVARPRIGRGRRRQYGMMLSSGSRILGSKVITTAVAQGDYFVLGLLAPKPLVGAYYFAYRLALQPIHMLAGNMQNVLFPTLALLRNERQRQRQAAMEALQVLAYLIIPFCAMQAALAPILMTFVFGEKWRLAVPFAQILSIALAFDALSWIPGSVLNARGEFRRAMHYSMILAPFFFLFMISGTLALSATGTALGVLAYYAIIGPIYTSNIFLSLDVPRRAIVKIYFHPTAICAVTIGLPYYAASAWMTHPLARFALILVGGSAATWLGLLLFASGPYASILRYIRVFLDRRRNR